MSWSKIIDQKLNQDYKGHAEKCTYTFSLGPEQFPGMRWARDQVINSHVSKLAEENSLLLELRVWEDTEPTWKTNYQVEVVATASPLWWNLIIGGVLLLLIGIAIYFTIEKTEDIAEYIGEKAPGAIPIMMIAGIGVIVLIGITLWKRKRTNPRRIRGRRGQRG